MKLRWDGQQGRRISILIHFERLNERRSFR
nr:MAG TPA: hypothetical protein [Caudoviricetes sp.]